MASINSTSTLTQVQDAYDDNASYAEDDSISKARAFGTAARILLRRLPTESRQGTASVRRQMDLIQKEIMDARSWLQMRDVDRSAAEVVHSDFADFKGPGGSGTGSLT